MNSSVIVFPGSNCDRDIAEALEKMQFKNQMVWHKETRLPKSDLIVVPGGFSYGDYLRSGAIAGKSLIINESNKNDVVKLIGVPHSKSLTDDNIWIYFERVLTKGEFHKLGQNILKENNVLFLKFNKFGIIEDKKLIGKDSKNKVKFSESTTENTLTQKSFVEKFLSSLRNKMYGKK